MLTRQMSSKDMLNASGFRKVCLKRMAHPSSHTIWDQLETLELAGAGLMDGLVY